MDNQELDTSWFDLKKYDELKELDLDGWHNQLWTRQEMVFSESMAQRGMPVIKETPVINYHLGYCCDRYDEPLYSFDTVSVKSTTAEELWFAANDERFSNVWECCKLQEQSGDFPKEEDLNLIETPFNYLIHEIDDDDLDRNFVTVDLSATDEQIMRDFSHWLTEYRKAMRFDAHTKNFTEKDLSEWVKYRLLPYIDLMLIAQLERKTITQAKIASLIFSDERNIDVVERLRKTTSPKAKRLFKPSTIYAIEAQVKAST